jgi:isopropylmalate/homocitrate/citramalate synthase
MSYYRKNEDGTFEPVGEVKLPNLAGPGVHMVVVDRNCNTYHYHVDPELAMLKAMKSLAAERIAGLIADLQVKSTELHNNRLKTDEAFRQRMQEAFKRYQDEVGDDEMWLIRPSAYDTAVKLIGKLEELINEAEKW